MLKRPLAYVEPLTTKSFTTLVRNIRNNFNLNDIEKLNSTKLENHYRYKNSKILEKHERFCILVFNLD